MDQEARIVNQMLPGPRYEPHRRPTPSAVRHGASAAFRCFGFKFLRGGLDEFFGSVNDCMTACGSRARFKIVAIRSKL